MDKILKALSENARLSVAELAAIADCSEKETEEAIKKYEEDGSVLGYTALLNWDKIDPSHIEALIEIKVSPKRDCGFDETAKHIADFEEVDSVFLMSGGFDLLATVSGRSFKDVAMFVAKRLSSMESVLSTATHFILKRYKEHNILCQNPDEDERRKTIL